LQDIKAKNLAMTKVCQLKVCGLSKLDQIAALIALKVDFLGFIFYPKSPRYVLNFLQAEQVKAIDFPQKVGVFVNESIANLQEIVPKFGLSYVQLHGDENLAYLQALKQALPDVKIIKVFRISAHNEAFIKTDIEAFDGQVDLFLFDTDAQSYGGTGHSFDWQILNRWRFQSPFMLSGGISLENLAQIDQIEKAIFALDINSKFEHAPGDKNIALITEFKQQLTSR
jgi:phosphoribosylanthranilate isomerase